MPSELAGWAVYRPAVMRRIVQARGQVAIRHAPALPRLTIQDEAIARGLSRDGVHITTLDALGLPGTDAMMADADRLSARLAQRRRDPAHAHRHTITATAQDLIDFPAILAWGLNDRLLDIVETYLGLPAAYDACDHFYSPADGCEAGPRLWHRDREDLRVVKIAVYVGDVGIDGGPLEVVRPEYAGLLPVGRENAKMAQAEMERRLGIVQLHQAVRSCTGRRGTVVLAETGSNYHRGRPPVSGDRSTIYHGYFSRLSPTPFFGERSPLERADLARIAASMPPRRRDALMWRDSLPAWQRFIPTNAMRV